MADFTALKTAIQTYIKQNGNEEITGEKLQEILLSMVTTLGDSAINDLITALNNEVAARQNADGTLQQNITNEATVRGNADTALGGRIDDEETARDNGDTALSNRLGSTITAENTAADQIGAEAEARAAADTALQDLIDGITDNIENGYVYAGIATPSSTPASGKVFYLALTADTYTNFGNIEVSQGINILKYNGSAWSLDAFIGIDDELTSGSNNLPKSGNVLENIIKNGSAFDLSAYNAVDGVPATYADLDAALAALSLLPAVYKQPGMSFRFVHTYDNKYVQHRLMSDSFNTTPANWQGVDAEPTVGSHNLVESGGVYNNLLKKSFAYTYNDKYNKCIQRLAIDLGTSGYTKEQVKLCYVRYLNGRLYIRLRVGDTILYSSSTNIYPYIATCQDTDVVIYALIDVTQQDVLDEISEIATLNEIVFNTKMWQYSEENLTSLLKNNIIADHEALALVVSDLSDAKNEIDGINEELNGNITTIDLTSSSFTEHQYIRGNGNAFDNDSFRATDYINIEGVNRISTEGLCYNNNSVYFIYFYDGSKNALRDESSLFHDVGGSSYNVTSIPVTAVYARFTCDASNVDNAKVSLVSEDADNCIKSRVEKLEAAKKYNIKSINAGALSANNYLTLSIPNTKTYKQYTFRARLTSLGNGDYINIIHGGDFGYASSYIQITSSEIVVYNHSNGSWAEVERWTHNITIGTYLEVVITVDGKYNSSISLTTSEGASYTNTTTNIRASQGDFKCISTVDMTEVSLSFSVTPKDIWVFGDSYLDYWPTKLFDMNYTNFLIDGFGGRGSSDAYDSLLLYDGFCRLPNVIIWTMGMNDNDNVDSVNASWLSCYNKVRDFCSSNGVNLILATVPLTGEVTNRNEYKDAIVRESGLPFVDVAKAVGSDISTDWYTGLRGVNGNIHPSSQGSKVIAMRFACDVPSIIG